MKFFNRKTVSRRNGVPISQTLAGAPPLEIVDQAIWQVYLDDVTPEGVAAREFAERWARLMQVELAAGKKLRRVANATSDEADSDAITGYMHVASVRMLVQCWSHGSELLLWHNRVHGVRKGTGLIVNPAVISL